MYYKSFDDRLCGRGGFQYEVGKTFTADTDDDWHWLHYSQYLSSTLIHSSDSTKIRICEVEPKGKTVRFKCSLDGYNKGYYYGTTEIHIVRELSEVEILSTVEAEKCPFRMIVEYLKPPFEWLLERKSKIKGSLIEKVLNRQDFSDGQVAALLPESHSNLIGMRHRAP